MKSVRRLWASIIFVLILVGASLVGFATGALRPVLGLDLEGGVSAVLKAPDGTPQDVMERALENIRGRVDAIGVAEPQIFVSGSNIEVQLPGLAKGTIQERNQTQYCLEDPQGGEFGCFATEPAATAALTGAEVQKQTTQVCLTGPAGTQDLPCVSTEADAQAAIKALTVEKQEGKFCLTDGAATTYGCFESKQEAEQAQKQVTTKATSQFCLVGDLRSATTPCFETREGADAALAAIDVRERRQQFCVISSDGKNLGCEVTRDEAEARLQQTGQERLLELIGTTARLEQRQVLETIPQGAPGYSSTPLTCPKTDTISKQCTFQALQDETVVYQGDPNATKYRLGPVEVTGGAIKRATAVLDTGQGGTGGWLVTFELTPEGSDRFAEVTTRLAKTQAQLAIVLDQQVVSAPSVQRPITGGTGEITGNFTEQEARDLATVLNAGALPVQLARQQVVTVSATLGEESLTQGIVAGIAGLIALFLYLLFYYRLLGIVAWLGMSIWAILALALVSLAGEAFGYSLTLAGVAGLVISLGVTADSYIVFFERLKDEVRQGKTPRTAVQPAFQRAFKTIVAADVVTGIAAGVLYVTAVSSVRGFALTLGVATVLDLFVVYFFKRPTVFLIARSKRLVNMRGFGLTTGIAGDAEPPARAAVPAPGGSR